MRTSAWLRAARHAGRRRCTAAPGGSSEAAPAAAEAAGRAVDPVTGQSATLEETSLLDAAKGLSPGVAGRLAGQAASARLGAGSAALKANARYARGVELLAWGYFPQALEEFEAVAAGDAALAKEPALQMAVGRALLEDQRYEAALEKLTRLSVAHAEHKGLQDALEEARLGVQLKKERHTELQALEKEVFDAKARSGVPDLSLVPAHKVSLPTEGQLPLEPEEREWLASYAGAKLKDVGVTWEEHWGRALTAKRAFDAGEVILTEKTRLFAPEFETSAEEKAVDAVEAKARPTVCSHCRGPVREVSKCSDCGLSYCSTDCQISAAGTYHQYECKILSEKVVKVIRDKLRAAGQEPIFKRYLGIIRAWSLATATDKESKATDMPWLSYLCYQAGEHKVGHLERANKTADQHVPNDRYVKPTFYGLMSTAFLKLAAPLKYTGLERRPDAVQLMDGMSQEYNTLWDKMKMNLMPPTYSVYPLLSLVNHSCLPNAELAPGRLTALRRIEAGEVITASYTPKNVPLEMKYHWLQKHRRFDCRCEYCSHKLLDAQAVGTGKVEEVGLQNLKQMQRDRDDYEDPNKLVTLTGRFTRAAEEYFDRRLEERLARYPREFREGILRAQEAAMELVSEKGADEALQELRRRRHRLQSLAASGVVSEATLKAEDAALSEVVSALEASRKQAE